MDLQIDTDWLLAYLLVMTRLSGLFIYSPLLGLNQVPVSVRMMFVLILALVFVQTLPSSVPSFSTLPALGMAVVREFLAGALMGLGVLAAFAALNFAGQMMDYQIGFNAAALFDRNTQAQDPLLSVLWGFIGGLVLVTLDAHHALLRAFAQMLTLFPVGGEGFTVSPAALTRTLGLVFVYGLVLASPVAIGVFLLDIASAFMSRSMPQLNIYFVALPVKILWGLFLLAATMIHAGPVIQRLFSAAIAAPLSH